MRNLARLQDEMTAAIIGGDTSRIAGELKAGSADPVQRFAIFRNNTYVTLTACLKTVFPVSVKLSDERFFNYAAHEFIAAHPPRDARLSSYGMEFPGFLAAFPPCRDYPILADMASIEWAIAEAMTKPEHHAMPLSEFSNVQGEGQEIGLRLQPNLRLLITRWPLIGVWEAHKKEPVVITGPLEKRTNRIAIYRNQDGIKFHELDAARHSFWRSLACGRSLEASARSALMRDPLFDLLHEVVYLTRQNLVTGLITNLKTEIEDEY